MLPAHETQLIQTLPNGLFVHQPERQFLLNLNWGSFLDKPCLPTSGFREAILISLARDLEMCLLQTSRGNMIKWTRMSPELSW